MADRNTFKILACGSVGFAVAGTPAWIGNHVGFDALIDDGGMGNYTLHCNPPVDSTECAVIITPRQAQAANAPTSLACAHTDDTHKVVTAVSGPGGGGGASVAADVPFDIMIVQWSAL